MEGNPEYPVELFRHSKALYKHNEAILASEDPQSALNATEEISPDLSEDGEKLAREKAEAYLSGLNPETDTLFFASSSMARALETAEIFRQVAVEKGFEIIQPNNVRNQLAKEVGHDQIREITTLSLHVENMLANYVFTSADRMPPINWDAVSDDFKSRWTQARAIIEAHDYGSWGTNQFHYSQNAEIQRLFPEIESSQELYEKEFKSIVKLVRFAERKISEANYPKKIRVLAFGHENYLSYALDKYFGDHATANCEGISFRIEGDNVVGSVKGKEQVLDDEARKKKDEY